MAVPFTRAMPARPSKMIRSDYNQFSQLCHELSQPVIVTRNGEDDLIVMSPEVYNELVDRAHITSRLLEAEREIKAGVPGIPADEVFAKLREMLHAKAES